MIIRMPSVSAVLATSVFLFVLSHYIHQVQQGKICLILCCLQLVDNPGILNPFFHGFLVYLVLLCTEQCFLNQAFLQFIPASACFGPFVPFCLDLFVRYRNVIDNIIPELLVY